METIGHIICYASRSAPAHSWRCRKLVRINHLYYIHSGTGGYIHNGKKYPFVSGKLYFIPYTADFTPYCQADDPIFHTYIDFEMIPPILTNRIVSWDTAGDEKIRTALNVFVLGGEMIGEDHCDLSPLYADPMFWELCKASVIYLIDRVTEENGVEKIADPIAIKALTLMHTRMKERMTVEQVARACYMNTDSFIRRFSRVVGITPLAYWKNLRLRTARYLRESGMTLAQIAAEIGYADASSLSHALSETERKT